MEPQQWHKQQQQWLWEVSDKLLLTITKHNISSYNNDNWLWTYFLLLYIDWVFCGNRWPCNDINITLRYHATHTHAHMLVVVDMHAIDLNYQNIELSWPSWTTITSLVKLSRTFNLLVINKQRIFTLVIMDAQSELCYNPQLKAD